MKLTILEPYGGSHKMSIALADAYSAISFREPKMARCEGDLESMTEAMLRESELADILIVVGQMDNDGCAREAAAAVFGVPLRRSKSALDHIVKASRRRGMEPVDFANCALGPANAVPAMGDGVIPACFCVTEERIILLFDDYRDEKLLAQFGSLLNTINVKEYEASAQIQAPDGKSSQQEDDSGKLFGWMPVKQSAAAPAAALAAAPKSAAPQPPETKASAPKPAGRQAPTSQKTSARSPKSKRHVDFFKAKQNRGTVIGCAAIAAVLIVVMLVSLLSPGAEPSEPPKEPVAASAQAPRPQSPEHEPSTDSQREDAPPESDGGDASRLEAPAASSEPEPSSEPPAASSEPAPSSQAPAASQPPASSSSEAPTASSESSASSEPEDQPEEYVYNGEDDDIGAEEEDEPETYVYNGEDDDIGEDEEEPPEDEDDDEVTRYSDLPEADPDAFDETLSYTTGGGVKRMNAYDLVCQIVQNETNGLFEHEALKAHAVATYSMLKYNNSRGTAPSVLLKPNVSRSVEDAVDEVLGVAVYYDGSYANTVYHSTSCGRTTSSQSVWGGHLPYLVSVKSADDERSPYYETSYTVTSSKMADRVEAVYGIELDGDPADWIEVEYDAPGGYVGTVTIGGETRAQGGSMGSAKISGRSFRENLLSFGIRSHCFDIEYDEDEDKFRITSYGYGHGVGMSQYGAHYMAEDGYNFVEILKHYYTGTEVY